jgi:hypothetical protein
MRAMRRKPIAALSPIPAFASVERPPESNEGFPVTLGIMLEDVALPKTVDDVPAGLSDEIVAVEDDVVVVVDTFIVE